MKGQNSKSACSINGVNGDKDITDIFSDKCNTLYNFVLFVNDDMLHIRSTIDHILHITMCSGYGITPTDVSIVVDHLKYGKWDGFEGLCSDHFINGTKRLYVFLLFTLFLSHGFTPDSLSLGTMVPIPKDKNTPFCSSSNYGSCFWSYFLPT